MSVTPEEARERVLRHRRVLNRLDWHLGCVACRGPLTAGVCPSCDPNPSAHPMHHCGTCGTVAAPGKGCQNCRQTGYDQTPCLVCRDSPGSPEGTTP